MHARAIAEREGWQSLSDPEVVGLARAGQRAVVTGNLRDFRPLHAELVAAGGEAHAGMVFVSASFRLIREATGRIVDALEVRLAEYPGGAVISPTARPGSEVRRSAQRRLGIYGQLTWSSGIASRPRSPALFRTFVASELARPETVRPHPRDAPSSEVDVAREKLAAATTRCRTAAATAELRLKR